MARRRAVVFYVSSHGYGHATRESALIERLRRDAPDLKIVARTQAPMWLLAPRGGVSRRPAGIDPGVEQTDGFTIDYALTLSRHEAFAARWDERVEREAAFLRKEGAGLVVSDMAPLAAAGAKAARVPSVFIGNFSWDVIFEEFPEADRWRPLIALYRGAYALADHYFRLPLAMEAPAFRRITDVPLLSRVSELTSARAREALRLPKSGRPVVLASFGGLGRGALDLSKGDDLSSFVFAGFGPSPRGLKAQWLPLPQTAQAHVDAMAACDAVLAKPGYGVLSEALAHGKPAVLIERTGFSETPALVRAFLDLGRATELSARDFTAGRWAPALHDVLVTAPRPRVPADGSAALARRLLLLLK